MILRVLAAFLKADNLKNLPLYKIAQFIAVLALIASIGYIRMLTSEMEEMKVDYGKQITSLNKYLEEAERVNKNLQKEIKTLNDTINLNNEVSAKVRDKKKAVDKKFKEISKGIPKTNIDTSVNVDLSLDTKKLKLNQQIPDLKEADANTSSRLQAIAKAFAVAKSVEENKDI